MGDRQDSDDDSTEDTMKEPVAKRMKRSRNGEPVGMDLEIEKGKMEQNSPAEDSASEDEEATPRNLIDPEANSSDTRDQRRMEMNSAKKVKERARRGKMADSVRSLRLLVPSCIDDKKVNQSQVLANTVTYITKIQAQLQALQKEVDHLKSQLSPSPLDTASKPSPSSFPNQRNIQSPASGARGRSVQTLKTAFSGATSPSEAPTPISRNNQYPSIKLTTKEGGRGRQVFSSSSTRSSQAAHREESTSGIYHREEVEGTSRPHAYREGPITISSSSPVQSPSSGSFNDGLNESSRGLVDTTRRVKGEIGGMVGTAGSMGIESRGMGMMETTSTRGSINAESSRSNSNPSRSNPNPSRSNPNPSRSNPNPHSSLSSLGGIPDASLHTSSFLQAKEASHPMKSDLTLPESLLLGGSSESDENVPTVSSEAGFGYMEENHLLHSTHASLSQQHRQQHGMTSTMAPGVITNQTTGASPSGGFVSGASTSSSSRHNHSSSMNIPSSSSRHAPSASSRFSISLLESALSTTPIGDSPFDQTFGSLVGGHKDLHRMEEDVDNSFGQSSFDRTSFDRTSSFDRPPTIFNQTSFNQPSSFSQPSSSFHASSLSFDPPSLDDIEDVGRWPLYGHSHSDDTSSSHHHHIIDDHNIVGEFDWSIPPQEAEASTLRHPSHAFPHSHTPQPPLPSSSSPSSTNNPTNNTNTDDFPPSSPSSRTSSVCECGKAPVYSGYF